MQGHLIDVLLLAKSESSSQETSSSECQHELLGLMRSFATTGLRMKQDGRMGVTGVQEK